MVTLEKMSKGGIYDHLAGGFHRYSVDERWVVPHFEKMSYDNSELLRNYVHAYQSFGEAGMRAGGAGDDGVGRRVAERSGAGCGFYASQDADDSLDDDGDYFTWTRAEAAAVLTNEELTVAGEFFDIGEIGDMHHNPQKNTLHIDLTIATVAAKTGVSIEEATELIASAKKKLYAARKLRKTPYVDKTVYLAWNAMMVSAYLEAGRVLGEVGATAFALRALDRILSLMDEGQSSGMS